LLLQRFQEENPHFDFSNAEINGNVPDARTFINGLDYNKK
jgi:splicing factor 3A subunit 3